MVTPKYLAIYIALVYILIPIQAQATELENIPRIQKNTCPFECCVYEKWTTHSVLKVYGKEGDTSAVVDTIDPESSFQILTGNIHIEQLGIVQANQAFKSADLLTNQYDNVSFQQGDIFHLLSYAGEGYFIILHKGKKRMIEDYAWTGSLLATLTQKAKASWWVHISYENKHGWVQFINVSSEGFRFEENISGINTCGY